MDQIVNNNRLVHFGLIEKINNNNNKIIKTLISNNIFKAIMNFRISMNYSIYIFKKKKRYLKKCLSK